MASTETIEQVKERIEELDPAEAQQELANGGVALVDTREHNEYNEAHIDGAELVRPIDVADRIEEVVPDHSQRVILYCASGNRSARAADQLRELGYENAASVRGGIKAWEAEGLPVISPEGMTAEQRMRYSRHTLLPEVGVEGQLKLLNAKVLLLGAGGLGAPAALYLAAAGIGTLGLVDDDEVDESNLQRQVIHNTTRVGQPKTESARKTIEELNPDVKVVEHRTRLDASNIIDIIKDYDVIVDGADNFPTRYLLNDASVRLRKPVVSASILAFDGQISTFMPVRGALLPLPLPDAPARRARPELRRRRRARRDGRRHGPAAGKRGHQARGRDRRAADRPPPALRLARDSLHRAQGPPRPRLPDLRPQRRGDPGVGDGQVPRLRALLRRLAPTARFPAHADDQGPTGAPSRRPTARRRSPSTAGPSVTRCARSPSAIRRPGTSSSRRRASSTATSTST